MAITPDPTTWTVQFNATQMAVTYPDHLTGQDRVQMFELHREAPEGVYTGKAGTLHTVTAKNGREFVFGMIPAERAEDIRWVAWPLAEAAAEDLEPTYTITHSVKIAGEWVRQDVHGVRESDVAARMDTLRWSGSVDIEYALD
jgi:hypothetical protein